MKEIIIDILIKLYIFTKINIFIKILAFFTGPIFLKIFQSFNHLQSLENKDSMSGTIGFISKKDNKIIKVLHKNIYEKLSSSLYLLENYLKYMKINCPFNFDEFYNINMKQLDLNQEKEYSFCLKKIFKNVKNVNIISIVESNNNYHIKTIFFLFI